jgi:hypothetical protein
VQPRQRLLLLLATTLALLAVGAQVCCGHGYLHGPSAPTASSAYTIASAAHLLKMLAVQANTAVDGLERVVKVSATSLRPPPPSSGVSSATNSER